tara:strand:- start:573 stop:887 length:315 start_codon:yes stop_codon:yes gene_type:complete
MIIVSLQELEDFIDQCITVIIMEGFILIITGIIMTLSIVEQVFITDIIGTHLITYITLLITTIIILLSGITIINIILQIIHITIAITTKQDTEAHYPHILSEEG